MKIGLYANTHGIPYRDATDLHAASVSTDQMQPVLTAQQAERSGFHSIWFSDHVCMPIASDSAHTANASGERAYSAQHNMLDAQIVMGAVAASTTTIKLGTTCLIAPYRHPLSDARQLATIDVLSEGRVIDGDTPDLNGERIRLYGIDAPEMKQTCQWPSKTIKCGVMARASPLDLVTGADVTCDPKDTCSFSYGGFRRQAESSKRRSSGMTLF